MAKKIIKTDMTQYMKKNNAIVLVAAGVLVGFFIGMNISLFVGGSAPKATMSIANVQSMQPVQHGVPSFDFDALEKQAQGDATNPRGWVQLGNAYFDADKPTQAIAAYEKALALDGSSADVWTDLGVMYRRNKEPQKAVECFTRAAVANPGHETARFNKGIVLLHDLNDRAGAIGAWEVLLKINPEAKTPDGRHLHDLLDEVRVGG